MSQDVKSIPQNNSKIWVELPNGIRVFISEREAINLGLIAPPPPKVPGRLSRVLHKMRRINHE